MGNICDIGTVTQKFLSHRYLQLFINDFFECFGDFLQKIGNFCDLGTVTHQF